MNAGDLSIDWLYREQLRVDQQWSVKSAKDFTWWAGKTAQRIVVIRYASHSIVPSQVTPPSESQTTDGDLPTHTPPAVY